MIDPDQFNAWFAMLCDRFNRSMGKPAIQEYYQYLSLRLTTEQWVLAARTVFHSADQWFPSSERLLSAAGQSIEQKAILEWDRFCQHAYDYSHPSHPEGLSAAAYAALKSIGGLRFLHLAEPDQRSHLRRDFLATYKAYSSPTAKHLGLLPPSPLPPHPPTPHPSLSHPFPITEPNQLPAVEPLRSSKAQNPLPPSSEVPIPSGMASIKTAFTAITGIAVAESEEDVDDMGMTIVAIESECDRLHWSQAQRDQAIEQRYQKRSANYLDDVALRDFLGWLQTQSERSSLEA